MEREVAVYLKFKLNIPIQEGEVQYFGEPPDEGYLLRTLEQHK